MLYIVGTSIGNIEDTTLRAFRTLLCADKIYAEDTRTFGVYYQKLQEVFNEESVKEQSVQSFHTHNEFEKIQHILDESESIDIVVVSESGMPVVSDPGSQLVIQAHRQNIPIIVVPGATALATAMVYSGVSQNVFFDGFLPKKESQIKKSLEAWSNLPKKSSIVFYESPERIQSTLQHIADRYPHADVTVCRELTKKFEEIIQGSPSELATRTYKGEITVVVSLS